MKQRIRWWLFPGPNLHARLRYRVLPVFFGTGSTGAERQVLDAGCGNGMLSYQSYRRGNRVLGISIKESEVTGCQGLFNGLLGIPEDRLQFRKWNLYEVERLGLQCDEIVCSEVLEHLARDAEVCRSFWNLLNPGGVLHLCCPNAEHPDNAAKELDPGETGGHVRAGYTMATYRALLEPIGFRIAASVGIGGPVRQAFNRQVIRLQERNWRLLASALCLASVGFLWMDSIRPRVPYSIYVRAVKDTTESAVR
jgi:SAM-dependent methyltransferase